MLSSRRSGCLPLGSSRSPLDSSFEKLPSGKAGCKGEDASEFNQNLPQKTSPNQQFPRDVCLCFSPEGQSLFYNADSFNKIPQKYINDGILIEITGELKNLPELINKSLNQEKDEKKGPITRVKKTRIVVDSYGEASSFCAEIHLQKESFYYLSSCKKMFLVS